MGAVGAIARACSCAGCVLGPQDRRGSAVRADVEAMARSGGAGGLPMNLGGRPDIAAGRRLCANVLCPFNPSILLIYRERASQGLALGVCRSR